MSYQRRPCEYGYMETSQLYHRDSPLQQQHSQQQPPRTLSMMSQPPNGEHRCSPCGRIPPNYNALTLNYSRQPGPLTPTPRRISSHPMNRCERPPSTRQETSRLIDPGAAMVNCGCGQGTDKFPFYIVPIVYVPEKFMLNDQVLAASTAMQLMQNKNKSMSPSPPLAGARSYPQPMGEAPCYECASQQTYGNRSEYEYQAPNYYDNGNTRQETSKLIDTAAEEDMGPCVCCNSDCENAADPTVTDTDPCVCCNSDCENADPNTRNTKSFFDADIEPELDQNSSTCVDVSNSNATLGNLVLSCTDFALSSETSLPESDKVQGTYSEVGEGGQTKAGEGGQAGKAGEGGQAGKAGEGGQVGKAGEGGQAGKAGGGGQAGKAGEGGLAGKAGEGGLAGKASVALATDEEGVVPATDEEGVTSATDQEGAASTTDEEGMATVTDEDGAASTTDEEGVASATAKKGVTSATDEEESAVFPIPEEPILSATAAEGVASAIDENGATSGQTSASSIKKQKSKSSTKSLESGRASLDSEKKAGQKTGKSKAETVAKSASKTLKRSSKSESSSAKTSQQEVAQRKSSSAKKVSSAGLAPGDIAAKRLTSTSQEKNIRRTVCYTPKNENSYLICQSTQTARRNIVLEPAHTQTERKKTSEKGSYFCVNSNPPKVCTPKKAYRPRARSVCTERAKGKVDWLECAPQTYGKTQQYSLHHNQQTKCTLRRITK